jgi:hypothetical protein
MRVASAPARPSVERTCPRVEHVTTDCWNILVRANASVALCLVAGGLALLGHVSPAAAAASYHAAGAASLLRARAVSVSSTATRPKAVSVSRTVAPPARYDVRNGRDAILLRGLISSPMALPLVHPRSARRYTAAPVASLADRRRSDLAPEVDRPRVHVKRRAPVTPTFARQVDCDVHAAKARDAFVSDAARRGPPSVHGRSA